MKYALNILLVLTLFQSSAQNLVPNPSFEESIGCPYYQGQMEKVDFWYNPFASVNYSTPDYFRSCSTYFGVPSNVEGDEQARTGVAYCGVYMYEYLSSIPNIREYITVQLTSPLIQGNTYHVEFYVSRGELGWYAINSIGAYLSKNDTLPIDELLCTATPQIVNSNGTVTNSNGWILISGEFTAEGGEQYLTLGNFLNDSSCGLSTASQGFQQRAYYYIDDVSIVSTVGLNELSKPDKKIIRITDMMGRETEDKPNTLLIYVYSDGTTEKVFHVM